MGEPVVGEEAATRRLYRRAQRAERLPWHRDAPHPWVMEAAGSGPLRVLDLGCGAGVDAVALAQRGHHVTAVDREPTAVRWTRERAAASGVRLHVTQGDVIDLPPGPPFDLVIDLGCLHSLRGERRRWYFDRLKNWVGPRGRYILMHFIKRSVFGARPSGPVRARPADLEAALTPWMHIERTQTARHPGRRGLGSVSSLTLRARRR